MPDELVKAIIEQKSDEYGYMEDPDAWANVR